MINKFQEILNEGTSKGYIPAKTSISKEWFRDKASQVSNMPINSVIESIDSQSYYPSLGRMMLFRYDPKTADSLPYFDKFPLIIPFKRLNNGFMGINFHYLPLDLRAKLMDGLYDYINNTNFDETTRIRITYELLSSVASLKYFRPCVKHYLNTSMRSRFLVVPPEQWDIALFLPLERFSKTTKQNVYRDSRKIIRGY
jgi:hypothetical protein